MPTDAERITALERRVEELTARLEASAATPNEPAAETVRRRDLLRKVAVGAAGAVVGLGVASRPAAATDGANLVIGDDDQTAQTATELRYSSSSFATGRDAFLVHDEAIPAVSAFPAVVGGSAVGPYVNGVYGRTLSVNGSGVVGYAYSGGGGNGVRGVSAGGGAGVRGSGALAGHGVVGETSGSGSGVHASSSQGYGVTANGGKANAFLPGTGAPGPNRPGMHIEGELVSDTGGDLWHCVDTGDPAVWRRLSGPTTAGAFHLLPAPVRVIDSRGPGGGGLFASGTDRVVTMPVAVPAGATGVLLNLTVTNTVGAGFLAVASAAVGAGAMSHSNTNWFTSGQVSPATAVSAINTAKQIRLKAGGGGSTHYVIDLFGFYR